MTRPVPDRSALCAVVVTYFPAASSAENLSVLASQVGKIVIVDNGSSAETLRAVEPIAERIGATVLRLGCNMGIATALNAGLKFAHEHGYRWLATFDQDSRPVPSMMEEMRKALDSYPQSDRVALITPIHYDRRLEINIANHRCDLAGPGWQVIPSAMTSGNLVDIQAALAIGGFDDSLFIDYVDHEFCLRLRSHGYQVLEATHARLEHSLGRMKAHRFGRRRVLVTNHDAVRHYYITRNRISVWRQYWSAERKWVWRDIKGFAVSVALVMFYEQNSIAKMAMICRGFIDAIRNVRGPLRRGG